MANESLIIGNNNWAVKSGSLLGYAVGESNPRYVPRELDVVRNTTATYVDSNGIIQTAPANVARIQDGALLVEPQRTNLDPNSQTFDGWFLSNGGGVSISSVNTSNPFGFESVSKIIPTTAFGGHRPYIISNYSAAGRMWVIAKADGYNYLSLAEAGGANGSTIIFNLSNGTISGSASGYTAEITSLGDGWYKCSLNMAAFNINVSRWVIIRNNDTTDDYSGDGTSGILIAHKQLEVGSFDTSAIITSGTIATRNADVINKSGISDLIGQTEGSMYIEFENKYDGNTFRRLLSINKDPANRIIILISNSNNIQFVINESGATKNSFTSNINGKNFHKCLLTYDNSLVNFFIDGVLVDTQARNFGNLNLSNIILGISEVLVYSADCALSKAILYKTALTDAQCISLTTL